MRGKANRRRNPAYPDVQSFLPSPAACLWAARWGPADRRTPSLPIMAAAILAEGPVALRGVPQLADVHTLALVLGDLGMAISRDGTLRLETVDPAGPRPLAAGAADAGEFLRAGAAAGPARQGRGAAARRLQHRRPAGRSAPQGAGCPGGRLAAGARLHRRPGQAAGGARIDLGGPAADRHRHGQRPECRRAGPRRDADPSGPPKSRKSSTWATSSTPWGRGSRGWEPRTIEVQGVSNWAAGRYRVIADRIEAATLLLAAAITGGPLR